MIFLSMIKTARQGTQTKHVQNGGRMRRGGECPKEPKLGYDEAECLVEIGADEEIQLQLSPMGRKQNI